MYMWYSGLHSDRIMTVSTGHTVRPFFVVETLISTGRTVRPFFVVETVSL